MSPSTDAWNEIFRQQGKVFREPHEDVPGVVELLGQRGARTVLDLGCSAIRDNGRTIAQFDASHPP